ncbi:hypothetical protein HWV62_23222 [Athelia sp. TMB]|nr:hypothetical protein HWV62_23222 [Athelia sp. TMB]
MPMRSDWRLRYDADHWMLVPSPELVQAVYAHYMPFLGWPETPLPQTLPSIESVYGGAPSFEYHVLAAPSLSKIYIDRYTHDAGGRHDFPFVTLGPIQSHVLPHFAIFNCGKKIAPLLAVAWASLGRRYELITGSAGAVRAYLQIVELYALWVAVECPPAFKGSSGQDLGQPPGTNEGSDSGGQRHIADTDSECSVDSDTALTKAEEKEMEDAFKMVSSWRTASSQALSQSHQREEMVASREDIGGYEQEPSRMACTVDLSPEGLPVDYYPPHLVSAALNNVKTMGE